MSDEVIPSEKNSSKMEEEDTSVSKENPDVVEIVHEMKNKDDLEQGETEENSEQVVKEENYEDKGRVSDGNGITTAISSEECKAIGEQDDGSLSDFSDEFLGDDFLEGLDVLDSWMEDDDDIEKGKEEGSGETGNRSQMDGKSTNDRKDRGVDDKRGRSTRDRGVKTSGGRVDRTDGDSRGTGRGNRRDRSICKESSNERKDESHNRRGRSTERRDSVHKQRTRNSQRERSLEKKNHNRTHGEQSSDKKEVSRGRSLDRQDGSRRRGRMVHREKSLEKRPLNTRLPIREKREGSPEKRLGSVRNRGKNVEGEGHSSLEKRKESDRNEKRGQVLDKKLDDKQERDSEQGNRKDASHSSSKQVTVGTSGNRDQLFGSDPMESVTVEKLKKEVPLVAYPHLAVYKKLLEEREAQGKTVAELNLPKQLPVIAPNEPVPPGTEDEYLFAETVPKATKHVPTKTDKVSSNTAKQEKIDVNNVCKESNKMERSSKNNVRNTVQSSSLKRNRSRSTWSDSVGRARKRLNSKQTENRKQMEKGKDCKQENEEERKSQTRAKDNKLENKERRSRSRNRDISSRGLERTTQKRFLGNDEKSGDRRERSREQAGKGERSLDGNLRERSKEHFTNERLHSRYPDLKNTRRHSPTVYERFRSPRRSLERTPVAVLRERSLSPSNHARYQRRHDRHRSRHGSLSPFSSRLSDSSLSLSSESEYRQKKQNYDDQSKQRKPPFLKELAEILADSYKRSSYPSPQPAYIGGPENAPHHEMVPSPMVYPPGPVDVQVPPTAYPASMFQPGVPVSAEGYPPQAYHQQPPPHHQPSHGPHVPPHPELPPPIEFAFTLPSHPSSVPHAGPRSGMLPLPVPAGEPMFQPQVGQTPTEMTTPGIQPSLSYASEASYGGESFSVPESSHARAGTDQPPPEVPPQPAVPERLPYSEKKRSLSSVQEASTKAGNEHFRTRDAVIQRCEAAIQILKAGEQLVMGGCFTFNPAASQNYGQDSQSSGSHLFISPLLSGKNLTFNFTKLPDPKKQTAAVKKTPLNVIRSSGNEKARIHDEVTQETRVQHPVPEPPKLQRCERCLEHSKKTFVDSNVQTNEIVLCSVSTQSDYQNFSGNDLHGFNVQKVQSDLFHGSIRNSVRSELDDHHASRLTREELPFDKPGPPVYNRSINSPSNLPFRDFGRGDILPESRSLAVAQPPFVKFSSDSMHDATHGNPPGRSLNADNSSLFKWSKYDDYPPMRESKSFDSRASDFHNSSSLSRPAHLSSVPSSEVQLKGILKPPRPSAPEVFTSRLSAAEVFTSRPSAPEVFTSRPLASEVFTSRPLAPEVFTSRPLAPEVFTSRPLAPEVFTSRPSAPDVFTSRPEECVPAYRSRDVWSRLGPQGSQYGSGAGPSMPGGSNNAGPPSKFSSVPSATSRENNQRFFDRMSNQPRSAFNLSGPTSQFH